MCLCPCVDLRALTIGGKEEVCSVLLWQPSDLIDLLLDLQTLKVVKLRLVALKCAVDIVLSLGEWLSLALGREKKRIDIQEMQSKMTDTCSQSKTPEHEPVPVTGILRRNNMAQTLYICNDTLIDLSRIYQSVWITTGNSS